MENFWDYSVWGTFNLLALLFLALLAGNALKRTVKFLQASLIPTSVLSGLLILLVSAVWKQIDGVGLLDGAFLGGKGSANLEVLTYHALALGFIASSLKSSGGKLTKKRSIEIFNTGVTTVSTYLLQAVIGLGITMAAALIMKDFFPAAGILLPFGYGQGTGQALNYGSIYEADFGFAGGRSFGLTVAAMGFLCASLGGVVHLNILKKRGKVNWEDMESGRMISEEIQSDDEIPMNGCLDKLTVQLALVAATYFVTYLLMGGLGKLLPGMKSVIYGFNFLIGVLTATLLKAVMNLLRKAKVIKKKYANDFLLNRVSNTCFDLMVTAGIAAIRLEALKRYWVILLILGVVGLVITYFYNLLVAKKLFAEYEHEQFLAMYGMLTGTASTGIMLLREVDPELKSPVSDNLVYQNFPAIVFGFPLMLLATLAPKEPMMTWWILLGFFVVMNILLFRTFIFRRRK